MADEPDNLMLAVLRKMDGKLDRVIETLADHGRRLTSLETVMANIHGDFAGQSLRIDRLEQRLDRIERRLQIGDA